MPDQGMMVVVIRRAVFFKFFSENRKGEETQIHKCPEAPSDMYPERENKHRWVSNMEMEFTE